MAYDDPHDVHLAWCKKRAREYMYRGDYANAFNSMMSDLSKHKDWQGGHLLGMMTRLYVVDQSPANVRRIIEGFN